MFFPQKYKLKALLNAASTHYYLLIVFLPVLTFPFIPKLSNNQY
jgi:hypothetical protein